MCLFFLAAGCAAQPPVAGELRFALMGDTPYSEAEAKRLERLIDELNAEPLAPERGLLKGFACIRSTRRCSFLC